MISGKPELLKKINTGIILEMVRREGPLSRAELAKRLHMSRPTVSKLVSELLAERVIVEVGVGPSSGGKKPIYLQINSKGAHVIGIHVAYPTIKLALANNLGDVLGRSSFQAPDSMEDLLSQIMEHAALLRQGAKLKTDDLSAMGIAFTGIVNPQQGEVVFSRFFPYVKGTAFKEELERRLGIPVFLDNDVYMGVLGEADRLEAQPQSIAFVTLGAMVGMGMMIDGQVYRGARYAASEIGDMLIDSSKQLAEGFRSSGGYMERWLQALGHEDVLREALSGNEAALKLVDEDSMKIAVLLANVISMFDPEQLIVGGTIIHYRSLFMPRVQALLQEITGRKPDLKLSYYGDDSELIGSLSKAIQSLQMKISIKQHGF